MKQKFKIKDKIPEKYHEKCGAAMKWLAYITLVFLIITLVLVIPNAVVSELSSTVLGRFFACSMLFVWLFYATMYTYIIVKVSYQEEFENLAWFKSAKSCVEEVKNMFMDLHKEVLVDFWKNRIATAISMLCSVSMACIATYLFEIVGANIILGLNSFSTFLPDIVFIMLIVAIFSLFCICVGVIEIFVFLKSYLLLSKWGASSNKD